MAIALKGLTGQASAVPEVNALTHEPPAASRRDALPHPLSKYYPDEPAWRSPLALAVFLPIVLLAAIMVRLWMRLERVGHAILHLVRTFARPRRTAPGQRYH